MSDATKNQKILSDLGLAGTYTGIENRVVEFPFDIQELSPMKLDGRFFYLAFRDNQPTIEEFVDFLFYKIIPFCIPRAKRKENYQKFVETGDDRYHIELTERARNLFIKAVKAKKRSGEPGELILFTLLEHFINAPQIACKMYLKTSEKMAVHGSDSIHVKYNPELDELTLIWGESKLYQNLSASLGEICKSISQFTDHSGGRAPRERDIDIIKDHVNIDDPVLRQAFLNYFDPYTPQSNKRKETYCCLSGFEFGVFEKLKAAESAKTDKRFKDSYSECIKEACDLFKEKAIKHNIEKLNFIFLMLPFSSVKDFRDLFYAKLGIQPDPPDQSNQTQGTKS